MMGFRTLLIVYVLGGLTFLPLLLAAVLLPAWYLQPRVTRTETGAGYDDLSGKRKEKDDVNAKDDGEVKSRRHSGDAAASGSFAVLRKYDLQAALTALGAKSGNGDKDNGDPGASNESVSVYQSMYRSVFAGNKPATNTILQQDDSYQSQASRRKAVPAQVLYIVLRHGHLMVYDSPSQVEVKHVISLAHHNVSLQAGTHDENDMDEKKIPESDLFIKRTAIVLTPVELPTGTLQQANAPPAARPFYLFSTTNIDKEAFYHALLAARSYPPTPRSLEPDALIKLQSALHSSSITPETRALNAIIGRVFLAVHRSDALNDFIRFKIEKKLARIQKPAYIPSLRIQSLNAGDAGPLFSNLKLRDLNISGDMTVSADMKYTGGLSLTFLAVARLDLGQRFKARTVDLVLKTSIKRISGPMLLHIKPPPSNRMWFCFEHVPEMEIRVEPVVSERKITYGFVLRAIEERVRTAIAEGLVRPNWDDIPLPFSDTRGSHARGGLWRHEGEPDNVPSRQPTKNAADRVAKSASVPDFSLEDEESASTGISSHSEENFARLRHAATMPAEENSFKRRTTGSLGSEDDATTLHHEKSPLRPKSLRSPSISSPAPSVAINGQNVEPVRADDAEFRPSSSTSRRSWYVRGGSNQPPPSKQAAEELRELRDRAGHAATRTVSAIRESNIIPRRSAELKNTAELEGLSTNGETKSLSGGRSADSSTPNSPTVARSFSTHSAESTATTSSASTSQSQANQTKRANVLAATIAASTAARNWGWNAIQRNKSSLPRPDARTEHAVLSSDQPMGRGQPLPPPGQPLPGPQKSLWGGVKRKPAPALPVRRITTASSGTENSVQELRERRSQNSFNEAQPPPSATEEEFEPWQENSGSSPRNTSQQSFPSPRTAASGGPDADENMSTRSSPSLRPRSVVDHASRSRSSLTPSPSPSLRKKASVERSNIPVLRSSTGALPPPLPQRPRPESGFNSPARSPTIPTAVNGSPSPRQAIPDTGETEEDGEMESQGLKVPDNVVEAVARENATEQLASGEVADDHNGRLNERAGVDMEVQEVIDERASEADREEASKHILKEETEAERGERLRKAMSGKLGETSVEAKFRRGEDVDEDDFERVNVEDERGDTEDERCPGEVVESESSNTADGIRERVDLHH